MNLLIKNSSELVDFLPISESDFDFDRIKPFIEQAQRKYILPLISVEEFNDLTNTGNKINLFKILSVATANLAVHLGFPKLNHFISNVGTLQANPKDEATALNWADRKDLQRSYFRAGYEALEQALVELETKKSVFTKWAKSDTFTLYDASFSRTATEFSRHQNINNSRHTYLKLKPYIREVFQQYFEKWLSPELISAIKADKKTNEMAQQCEAAFTIMKAIQQDGFIADHTGVQIVFELLPWEKLHLPSEESIFRKTEHKRKQGEEALKRLEELLICGDFDYEQKNREPKRRIKKLNSGLSF